MTAMKRLTSHKLSVSVFTLLILSVLTVSAYAQTPLDARVLNERLNRVESQLRGLQGQGPAVPLQMPSTPEEAGMEVQTLPTDVASRLQVRLLQLERLVETLTGQLEETRFEVSQMRAQLQQFSNDISYRLAVLEQAAGVSSAVALPATGAQAGLSDGMSNTMPVPGAPIGIQQSQSPVSTLSQAGTVPPSTALSVQGAAPQQAPSTILPATEVGRVEPNLNMPMSSPVQPQPQMAQPQLTQPQPTQPQPTQPQLAQPQSAQPQLIQPQLAQPTQAPAGTQLLAPGQVQTAPVQTGPVNQGNTFGVIRTDAEGNVLPPSPEAVRQAALSANTQQPVQAAPPAISAAPSPGPVATDQIATAPNPMMAMTALPTGTPKEQYDYAFDILRQADYARAETALRMFLDAHPADTLAGNAQYWLGETFYVRGDFEQAAVEFLSGYQTYPNSNKAPDNLLKLGLSMARLGQTDGACTALSRLATEYPEANDTIRRRAQTERARLSCS